MKSQKIFFTGGSYEDYLEAKRPLTKDALAAKLFGFKDVTEITEEGRKKYRLSPKQSVINVVLTAILIYIFNLLYQSCQDRIQQNKLKDAEKQTAFTSSSVATNLPEPKKPLAFHLA